MLNSSLLSNRFLFLAFCLLIAIFSVSLFEDVYAHESRPIYVEIQETEPDVFSFKWKTPRTIPKFNIPSVIVPSNSEQVGMDTVIGQRDSYVKGNIYRCDGGISGEKIELSFPAITPSAQTLIRLQTLSGITHSILLDPGELGWEVPAK